MASLEEFVFQQPLTGRLVEDFLGASGSEEWPAAGQEKAVCRAQPFYTNRS